MRLSVRGTWSAFCLLGGLSSALSLALFTACSLSAPVTSPSPTPLSPAASAHQTAGPAPHVLRAAAPEPRPEHARAKVPVSPDDPQWGSVDAPVTIVEISDF